MKINLWTLVLLFAVLMLPACGAQTTGKDIVVKNTFEIEDNYGTINISPDLATTSGDTEQTTKNPTDISPPVDMVLTPAAGLAEAAKSLSDAKITAKTVELADEAAEINPDVVFELPASDVVRQKYSKNISVDGIIQAAYIFPKTGPEYCSGPMRFVWDGGAELLVPDPDHMFIGDAIDARKYQPGTWDKAPGIKTMEVYAPRGTKPAYVDMYCKK